MKNKLYLVALSSLLFSMNGNAASMTAQVGKDYTEVNGGLGTQGSGLALNGSWLRSDHEGQRGSLGATFGLPLGPLSAYVGGKAIYLSPKHGDDGGALAAGGGVSLSVRQSLDIYGEAYGAPSSLTSGSRNESYTEAKVGARYTVMKPLSIDAGYRVVNLKEKNRKDNKIADGVYVGAGISF